MLVFTDDLYATVLTSNHSVSLQQLILEVASEVLAEFGLPGDGTSIL